MKIALPLLALLCAAAARAQTLPEGHARVSIGTLYVHQALPQYDFAHVLDGDTVKSVLSQFLDSKSDTSARDYSLLLPGLKFSGSVDVLLSVPEIDYGITDRLTATAIWPVFDVAMTNARLSAPQSLLGYNLDYDPHKPTDWSSLTGDSTTNNSPIALPTDSRAVTGTEGMQHLLTNYFGYRRIQPWRSYGMGDPVLAMNYGVLNTDDFGLRATALGQIPLGQTADPDNPLSIPFSDGHLKMGARLLFQDREVRPFTLSVGLNYLYHFRDHPIMRIYRFAAIPLALASSDERVSRLQGYQLGMTLGLQRSFLRGLLVPSVTVGFEHAAQDSIRGSLPADSYAAVMSNTGKNTFSGELSLTLSTVERFLTHELPLPTQFTLSVRGQLADHGIFDDIAQLQVGLSAAFFL